MDKQELENLIVERFQNLQPEIQAVIVDPNYEKQILDIAQKYSLTPEQISDFELNTTLVLLGNTHPDEYPKELTEDLKLAPVVIKQIVDDVNQIILKNVLPMIRHNFTEDDEREAVLTRTESVKIDPKFSELPMELQGAIAQSDYQKKLYDIGTKYKLQIGKMATLEDLTVKFIRAEISGSQYENNLALELDLEAGKARELATDVNEGVMKPIREIMKETTTAKDAQTALATPTPAITDSDPVPLPPYSSKPTKTIVPVAPELKPMMVAPVAATAKTTNEMYAEHGIEILDDSVVPQVVIPQVEKPAEKKEEIQKKEEVPLPPTPVPISVPVPVENITLKESGIDVLKEKLDGITVSKQTVSDHSLSHDPYHEEI